MTSQPLALVDGQGEYEVKTRPPVGYELSPLINPLEELWLAGMFLDSASSVHAQRLIIISTNLILRNHPWKGYVRQPVLLAATMS